jgi:hypothetical protein
MVASGEGQNTRLDMTTLPLTSPDQERLETGVHNYWQEKWKEVTREQEHIYQILKMTIVQRKNKPFTTPSSNNSIGASSSDHHHVSTPTSATINLGGSLQINKPTNSGVEYSSSKNRVSGFMVMTVVSFTSIIVTLILVCIFSVDLLLEKQQKVTI